MAEARMVTFALRNGEKRTYKDVTRIDDSRAHNVLVYSSGVLIATINKHDVITYTVEEPARTPDEPAEASAQP